MKINDLRHAESGLLIDADLCIIGSGPAALTIARECLDSRLEILILESGGLTLEPEADALSAFESVGSARDPARRKRVFGGASHVWGGRCIPFDEIDFEARRWVPHSGWPISPADLASPLIRAAAYLGITPDFLDSGRSQREPAVDPKIFKTISWQYSSDDANPRDSTRFGPRFLSRADANVSIWHHATAIHITTNQQGSRVESVEISSPEGKRATVRTRALVLAAGGIENARLLLCSRRIMPQGVGNQYDLVGRFLMDHPSSSIGDFDLRNMAAILDRFEPYRTGVRHGKSYWVDGLGLSAAFQRSRQLLNCAAWLDELRAPDDPFSAAKRLASRTNANRMHDAWAIVSQPGVLHRGLYSRLVRGKAIRHELLRLSLRCTVEQAPDPASRVYLSEQKDKLGVPLPKIDWRIGEKEVATIAKFGRLLVSEFERIGLPPPLLKEWILREDHCTHDLIDVAHPMGTTRMSTDAQHGVTDENCQVHGVDGLFVAGSSVFPGAGHANPTLMIVALAIRLADHLKTRHFGHVLRQGHPS